jgi:hypothetical protein
MIRTNSLVLIPMLAGFVVGLLLVILGLSEPAALIAGFAAAALTDVVVRMVRTVRSRSEWDDCVGYGQAFISPGVGAHIWYVPVWAVSGVVAVVLLVQHR